MNKNLNIFIACHKDCKLPKESCYVPLHVGAKGKKDLGFVKDSTGNNISLKNSNYCELTGIYWIWKNVKSKYVGLVHYRRYFFNKSIYHTIDKVIKQEEVLKLLKKYDVIVPNKTKLIGMTTYEQFNKYHHIEDYNTCRKVISEKYPEYVESFDRVSNRKYFYAFNMCIINKKLFDEYSKWLFDILFEVEKRVDISNYTSYEQRLFGFLSERLFNVWLDRKNLKLKELYVYNTDEKYYKQRIINIIKNIIVH